MHWDAEIVCRQDGRVGSASVLVGTSDTSGVIEGKISLSHKGKDEVFGSATEYVVSRPAGEIEEWSAVLHIQDKPEQPLRRHIVVVEDASPDTCLALLALQLRLKGEELPWIWSSYSALWEEGDTEATGEAEHSFGALLSALVHVELQKVSDPSAQVRSHALAAAVGKGIAYATGLISRGHEPNQIPVHLAGAGKDLQKLHREARSRLAYERMAYRQVSRTSTKLQLAIHLAGSRRKTLVDAILFSETLFTGAMKHFSRGDPDTFTGRGYAMQALYRPSLKGTGNDMTIDQSFGQS